MNRSLGITLNAVGLYGLALIVIAAFAGQIFLNELPCPLCLLQRVLFSLLAIGPVLNIRFGPRTSHYALSLLSAIMGATVSARQILLHIIPGDPGFGSTLLGYHYYTYAFAGFAAAMVLIAVVLLFDVWSHDDGGPKHVTLFARGSVWLVMSLTAANAISTLLECGFIVCADDPKFYELLKHFH